MMKPKLTSCFLSLFLLIGSVSYAQEQKSLTEADYQQASSMLGSNVNKLIDNAIRPRWTEDSKVWYKSETEDQTVYKLVDPAKGKVRTASSRSELFEKGKVEQETGRPSRRTAISSDGKYEAFIKDWNLWLRDVESGEERALTTDGIRDFGYATDNAGWKHSNRPILSWSPDSRKIATFQQDQRHVSTMYLVKTMVGAPELMEWKYPLPGDEDIIRIHRVIIDISGEEPRITPLKLAPDARRGTLCDDISCEGGLDDVSWSEDSNHLVFVSTSRDHKEAHVRMADCKTGEVRDIFQEIVETQFESGQGSINWKYFSSTQEIVWYSERSDWGHLYLYDVETGTLKHPITQGEFVVLRVVKMDQENRIIYFIASGREEGNPYYQYFYRVDFSGENLQLLTPEPGNHRISFSPDGQYFTDSYSQPDVSPVHELRSIQGELITVMERTDISRLEASGWKLPTPFKVRSA
ncbi:MAG: DPP IV N-terminal domain-containing protein, partial [Bacteroidota bacterium]|nr:DPP IV N-terminal domain-containing protein [Bacteroidota bacterium]